MSLTMPAIDKIVDAVIDEVAEMQLLGAGFRPVFLLDTPAFGRARSYGYPVELVTPTSAVVGGIGWTGPEYVGCSGCIDDESLWSLCGRHDWSRWSGRRHTRRCCGRSGELRHRWHRSLTCIFTASASRARRV